MFKQNEGPVDRLIRILVGVLLLGLALFRLAGTAQIIAMIAGVLAVVTGALGFCALYRIFGISTKKA